MLSSPVWWRGGVFVLCLVLFSGEMFADGSPRAFQKFAGDYDSTGTFRNQTVLGTVNATIAATGGLEIADSPKASVLTLNGTATTTQGVESVVAWTLDFRRKNVCTVKVVFASGTTMTMTGKYEVKKKHRVSFEGQTALKSGTVTKIGQSAGRLRMSAASIRYVQKDDYADQDITVRQNLTRQ